MNNATAQNEKKKLEKLFKNLLTNKKKLVNIMTVKKKLVIKRKEVLKMKNKKYFYGQEISAYGVEHNRVDYGALAKSFDAVLCNDITRLLWGATIDGAYSEAEIYSGTEYDDANEMIDIFQYYIISHNGAELLKRHTDEIVYYLPALDIFVWGVTHCGTSWDYVLTDIKIEDNEK